MYQVQLVGEQQESRPLLSPSIDDFLSESRIDGPVVPPLSSSTAVLSTAVDLVDLSEPGAGGGSRERRKEVARRRPEETELIQVEVERPGLPLSPHSPERNSLDSVSLCSPLERWEEVNLQLDAGVGGGWRRKYEKRCTSHHSSSELLWSAEFRTDPSNKNCEVRSFDEMDLVSSSQDISAVRQRRRARSLLTRNRSLEEEFVRAKAAVESDTEFWDKMQAEWEELARRNWLEESESEAPDPPSVSQMEMGYSFHTNNPYRDWPNAFVEGQEKAKEGDLNNAVLLLEAAILQDPQDTEAWQLLGMTQAENENEQAAIVSLQRSLQLRPNNLPALMALAVSFTNSGLQQEACEVLRRWIRHHPHYKHLLQDSRSPLQGSPHHGLPAPPPSSYQLAEVKALFQEVALLKQEVVDPDLQTGLGVLFNLSSEFDKAVEAFTAALSVRPEDYLLWNRLGATLANGDRSEEAVEAYTRALELQPGFIRSRYNLGISCINLGAHREAASNFLTALNQQRQNHGHNQQVMSSNIWAALRIAISMMDRPELFQAASVGDLDLLMRAFDMEDI
ncbi:PEX5-related protein [Lampris incognitus]|uniref:PEX5-related protein n=1 Tax=Lampris incognitus TaxID=2546036 RepID=UPI0024B54F43|nr:PEX5-related protein [Lampris incognitus]